MYRKIENETRHLHTWLSCVSVSKNVYCVETQNCVLMLFLGYGLICYEFLSTKGLSDCASNRGSERWFGSYDTNAMLQPLSGDGKSQGESLALYIKTCVFWSIACIQDVWPDLNRLLSIEIKKCAQIHLCSCNLCNGTKMAVVSTILLFTYALLDFFSRLQQVHFRGTFPSFFRCKSTFTSLHIYFVHSPGNYSRMTYIKRDENNKINHLCINCSLKLFSH